MSSSIDQATQSRALYFGLAAIVVGFGVYTIWGEQLFPSESTKSSAKEKAKSLTGQAKQKLYSPKGDPQSWSEDDLKKYLSTRNMAVGHDPSIEELRAMVFSKLNEPQNTGFDDPRDWSEDDLKDYLKAHNMTYGDAGRMELLAMVESKMHEPK